MGVPLKFPSKSQGNVAEISHLSGVFRPEPKGDAVHGHRGVAWDVPLREVDFTRERTSRAALDRGVPVQRPYSASSNALSVIGFTANVNAACRWPRWTASPATKSRRLE